jgi:hypothetical protein
LLPSERALNVFCVELSEPDGLFLSNDLAMFSSVIDSLASPQIVILGLYQKKA